MWLCSMHDLAGWAAILVDTCTCHSLSHHRLLPPPCSSLARSAGYGTTGVTEGYGTAGAVEGDVVERRTAEAAAAEAAATGAPAWLSGAGLAQGLLHILFRHSLQAVGLL